MKTKVLSFVVWALALFMVACSDSSSYTNAIPKDAALVVSMDLQQMASKGELTGEDGKVLAETFGKSFASEMGEQEREVINKVLVNPNESGLDFKNDIYLFATSNMEYGALLAAVSDYDKLSSLTELLVSQQVCEPFNEEDGRRYAAIDGKSFMVYDENALLVLFSESGASSEELKAKAFGWLSNGKDNSYVTTDEFKKMADAKADIALVGSLECIPLKDARLLSLSMPEGVLLKDIAGVLALNFEKGKVQMDIETLYKSVVAKEWAEKQMKIYPGKLKGKFLEKMDGESFLYFAGTLDGEEAYSMLMENEMVKTQLDATKMPFDLKAVLGSLDGEVAFAMAQGKLIPQCALFAEVKDENVLEAVEKFKSILDKVGVEYGVEDGVFYISNMETPKSGESLEDAGLVSDLDGKYAYTVIDFEELGDFFKALGLGGSNMREYMMMTEYVKSFTVYAEDMTHSCLILKAKNEDVNVLKQIVDFGRKMSGM